MNNAGPRRSTYPIYLVCQSSGDDSGPWSEAVRSAIMTYSDFLALNPVIAEPIHFAVVEFSTFLREIRSLSPATHTAPSDPHLTSCDGGGDYGALFDELRALIDYDLYRLRQNQLRAFRPLIVLLLRTLPTDDHWPDAYQRLIRSSENVESDSPTAPLIAVVHARPDLDAIAEAIAYPRGIGKTYRAHHASDVEQLLAQILTNATTFLPTMTTIEGQDPLPTITS